MGTGKAPAKKAPYKKPYVQKNITQTQIANIVKNEIVKQGIKPEKKHDDINLASTDYAMGQCNGNANGFFSADVTPYQVPGSNANQHTGNEISITSFYMQMQIRQMSAATAPCRIKFYIVRLTGTNLEPSSDVVGNMFLDNQFIGGGSAIVDANSQMNLDYMPNYQIVRSWTVHIRPDQFSGQQMVRTLSVGKKFKKPYSVKWYTTTAGAYSVGRLVLIALPDSGNASTTTASTLTNLPVTVINTGQLLNFNLRWYYTDN